jgi:competence protein ComEC
MASDAPLSGDLSDDSASGAALQHGSWRRQGRLSRVLPAIERILGNAGFDRAPWLAVAFAAGIAAWFGMARQSDWLELVSVCLAASVAARLLRADGYYPYVRTALTWVPMMIALGCLTVWGKSLLVGQDPLARPEFMTLTARVLERDERPAERRTRIVVAARRDAGEPLRLRLNLPEEFDDAAIAPGALVWVQARLMPPAPILSSLTDGCRAVACLYG